MLGGGECGVDAGGLYVRDVGLLIGEGESSNGRKMGEEEISLESTELVAESQLCLGYTVEKLVISIEI